MRAQPQRAAFDSLPSRVVAAVPRGRLLASPHYDGGDARRNAPFMELALCAAAEVRRRAACERGTPASGVRVHAVWAVTTTL